MATRPDDLPGDWAVDTGRRTEPSSGQQDSGFVEATRTPAKIANWVLGYCAAWINYLSEFVSSGGEFVYQAAKTRSRLIGVAEGHPAYDETNDVPHWVMKEDTGDDRLYLDAAQIGSEYVYFDISAQVPVGATITEIHATLKANAAAGSGNQPQLEYFVEDASISEVHTGPLGTVEAANNTNEQTISITGLSLSTTGGQNYTARVRGSTGALGAQLYRLKVIFTQPGPMY